jgi:hypothetical protein
MTKLWPALSAAAMTAASLTPAVSADAARVQTSGGWVTGQVTETHRRFLGIPPIGARSW